MKNKCAYMKRESTSFRGLILAHYTDLVALYGEPLQDAGDHKTDAEWIVETPHGIATIYNYKDGVSHLGKHGIDVRDICEWHVGTMNQSTYTHVREAVLNRAKMRFIG